MAKNKVSKLKGIFLTDDDKANIVEEYLGVHPRYFVYQGIGLQVNIWLLESEGKSFNGFIPHLKELGQL